VIVAHVYNIKLVLVPLLVMQFKSFI